ncbi:hypothetical protein [Parendozoicomonas haliclonae]|uniref:Uncharacterized protein n=1 Tax=Parendozoicomonas haliclonae TaxID=1960125 RepID=A0A1X7ALG9_9GAMM|nr:hypothetical protein [Parendozoicomonas haliclonae]SMA48317.1 hypothetical protein EHSB41UT_02691 [Parendozoicomonas haliclonae]
MNNEYESAFMRISMRTGLFNLFTVGALVISSSLVHAALPPGAYEHLQENAEESLTVFVCKVNSEFQFNRSFVNAEVIIDSVERSASELQRRQRIPIQYDIYHGRLIGPRKAFLLETGHTYQVYLNNSDDGYTLAAYGESFVKLDKKNTDLSCQQID